MHYWTIVAVVVVVVCSCERSIEPIPTIEPIPPIEVPLAATPEQLMDNLNRAMRDRDKALYETLLDEDFQFTEFDCLGNIVFYNDLETELKIIVGSREGSGSGEDLVVDEDSSPTQKALFDIFSEFQYDFSPLYRSLEPGTEFPETYKGDPDAHPDEDWTVFSGRVQMLMIDENGEGYRVDQTMTFKLRYDGKGHWRMVRWIDDPLYDCGGAGKILVEAPSWGYIKNTIFPIGSS